MKQISALMMVFFLVLLSGCSKGKESESGITAEVVKEEVKEKPIEEENIATVKICYDTDNGIIKWERGNVMGYYNNTKRFEFEDYCLNKNYVREYYCENEEPLETIFLCKNGCVDGHCS